MIIVLLLSFLIQFLQGYSLVSIFDTEKESLLSAPLKIFLGIGIGFGITSLTTFLWLIANSGHLGLGFIVTEIFISITLLLIAFYLKKRRYFALEKPRIKLHAKSKLFYLTASVFYLSVICSISTFLIFVFNGPHGGWDAWAIWNLRARYIFRGAENWTRAFSGLMFLSHPDYPLLLPLSVVRYWEYFGSETLISPALVAGLFVSAVIGLLVSSVNHLHNKIQGFLAGLVLLWIPRFVELSSMQYADIPLSFFLLAIIVFITLHNRSSNSSYLILAGISGGFIAWTKNEGILIVLVIALVWSVITLLFRGFFFYKKQAVFFLLGLIPGLLFLIYFKIKLAPENDIVSTQSFQSITDKITDSSRYILIIKSFFNQLNTFEPWYLNPLLILLIYAICVGTKINRRDNLAIITNLISLLLILAGYFFIYLITPQDLEWHLMTSLDRLLIQVFPSYIFIYFMIVRNPRQPILHNKGLFGLKRFPTNKTQNSLIK